MSTQPTRRLLEQLQTALLDAFDHASLTQLVRHDLALDLETLSTVPDKQDLPGLVAALVTFCASQEGGLLRLLRVANMRNPTDQRLATLANEWAELEFSPLPLPENHPALQARQQEGTEGSVSQESTLPTNDGNHHQRSNAGGVTNFVGNVEVGHDFIAGNKEVGGDEVKGNKYELHIGQLIQQAQQALAAADSEAPAPGASPYKGMRYFDMEDADLFFGREQLTAELVSLLHRQRFLAIVGASGSGKSSLVRAGLIAALRRGSVPGVEVTLPKDSQQWPVYLLTPGERPLENLAAVLTRESESVSATSTLINDLQGDIRNLHLYNSRLLSGKPDARLLLVVDQFEELFTLCHNLEEQRTFLDQLLTASLDYKRTVVVITLRADFYASCARFEKLRNALDHHQKYIGPMNRGELQRTIEEPARLGQWTLEPELVQQLLAEVGDEPGMLPLLSHALNETWKRRRGRRLTLADYTAAGGVKGAIAQTAEATYHAFSEQQQEIARAIFLRLTALGEGVQDTRRRIAHGELRLQHIDEEAVHEVLAALAIERLVTTDADEIQVTHEAVIREWPRLRGWLGDDREGQRIHRHLTESAKEWHVRGENLEDLYRGNRLSQAQEWAEEHHALLSQQEAAFLQASLVEAEAQMQRERELAAEREAIRQRELENERRLREEQSQRADAEAQQAKAEARRSQLFRWATMITVLPLLVASGFG